MLTAKPAMPNLPRNSFTLQKGSLSILTRTLKPWKEEIGTPFVIERRHLAVLALFFLLDVLRLGWAFLLLALLTTLALLPTLALLSALALLIALAWLTTLALLALLPLTIVSLFHTFLLLFTF